MTLTTWPPTERLQCCYRQGNKKTTTTISPWRRLLFNKKRWILWKSIRIVQCKQKTNPTLNIYIAKLHPLLTTIFTMAALVILITLSQDRSLLGVYFIVRTYPGWLGNVEDIYKKMLIGIYHANHLHYCALLPSNQRRPSERTLPTREFRKKEVHLHSDLIYYIYRLRQSETLMREDWYFHLSSSVAAHQFMQSSCFSDVQSSNVQLIDLSISSPENIRKSLRDSCSTHAKMLCDLLDYPSLYWCLDRYSSSSFLQKNAISLRVTLK